jgi:hypothetical protein
VDPGCEKCIAELRRHVEGLIAHERELREAHERSGQQAIEKAERAMTVRLDAHNDILGFMKDQGSSYALQIVVEGIRDALAARVNNLDSKSDKLSGGGAALWAAIGFALALAGIWVSSQQF